MQRRRVLRPSAIKVRVERNVNFNTSWSVDATRVFAFGRVGVLEFCVANACLGPKQRRSHQCLGLLIELFETRSEIARWNSVEKSVDGR